MCVFSHMRVYVCLPGCTCTLPSVFHPPLPPPLLSRTSCATCKRGTSPYPRQCKWKNGGTAAAEGEEAEEEEEGMQQGPLLLSLVASSARCVCFCWCVCVCTYSCGIQGHTHICMLQEDEEEEDSYSMIDPKLASPMHKEIIVVIWQNIISLSPTSCVHWFRFGRVGSVR